MTAARTKSIPTMETEKKTLLQSLHPERPDDRPGGLTRIDPDRFSRLAGPIPTFDEAAISPETDDFVQTLCKESEQVRRLLLASDLDFIKEVARKKKDVVHHGPFGLIQAAFPIQLNGEVVSCLWTGKMAGAPLSGARLDDAARESGLPADTLASHARSIPVFNEALRESIFTLYRCRRDTAEHALASHLSIIDLNAQLLESERVRSLGSLSGGIAHHFNNLLSVILGYSSFLLNQEEMPEDSKRALQQISEAAQRGRRLTQEVLAFAGSEAETETFCSVHEILSSVLSLLETQAGTKVRIETNLQAANDIVCAPKSSIHQIVFNVLSNAIDSMPGGGLMSVSTDNINFPIEDSSASHLRIAVLDAPATGTGSPAGRTDRPNPKLSSLYGIVNKLEGSTVISREANQTNRAEVVLPVADRKETRKPGKEARKALSPSLIWVVDDDPIFREMCKRVLSDEGHSVEELSSGTELHEKWNRTKQHPHLLIVDFSMPEYNGLEVCEWLRKQGSRASVILVSGFSPTQPDIRRALNMRKTYFLQKPFPVPELGDVVTVALGETLLGDAPSNTGAQEDGKGS